jgi:hypothetical protein
MGANERIAQALAILRIVFTSNLGWPLGAAAWLALHLRPGRSTEISRLFFL